MASGLTVRGLREFQILCAVAGKEAKRDLTAGLREVAEPIRADAESLAASGIPRIGPKWSRMRVGVTRRSVYVAPRQRGLRSGALRRPNFAALLESRAMTPALQRNESQIEQRVEHLFQDFANRWNRR